MMEQYHVLEMIGEGSFGRVFKGRRKFSGQVVALKFIPKVGRSEKELRSLKREIEIMRGLKHPNIVMLLDSFETQLEVVVVTEYAEGELFQILEDDGSLPESQVREIACQLVSALYYLHSHRILHRDMKPQNILLSKGGVVKLCDFGFARAMSVSTLVLTSFKGTPLYMSPELVEEKPYDHTADLWSLGCILYELHTGAPPFYTNSIFQLAQLIVKDPVKWPENMSQDCMSFLKGLLNKDPQKRLAWPGLLHHPFVADGVIVLPDDGSMSPLTITPSPDVQAMKQLQVAKKSAPRSGKGKFLHRARDMQDKKQKNRQDQEKNGKALVNNQPRTKTAPAGEAPTSNHSLGSTFTVCRNSAHPPANQHQANDIGVARVSLAPCKGPISRDYEREFPSVEVGPRLMVRRSRPGHTSLTSIRMDSDEQDVNSDDEWQRLVKVTDHMSVSMDPHIHQKLKKKLLRCKEQLLNGKLEEPSTILQLLKILSNIILTADPAEARRIGEEIDVLHNLFSLIEVMLRSPEVMEKPWSERVLGELTAVLLPIWENQPDWQMKENRAEDLCQLLISLFLNSDLNALAPQAAAVLSLFVHYGVCVNIHMDRLTALLEDVLSGPEEPHYPLPPGWGMCDSVLALILYFLSQSESSVLYDFLNSEVWCHLWTKVGTILESTASKPDFLSVEGLSVLLSIALFAFSNEPYECLCLFYDDDKKLLRTLIRLLTTDSSSAPLKRGPLWGGSDMNSLAVMSCQLLCFPFAVELPQEKMAAILHSYQSLNLVEGLVQVIQVQSPALLELPLFLLLRLCLSSPKYAVPSFITAAQDFGFLPQSAPSDQTLDNLNQSESAAEQPRLIGTPHKNQLEMGRIDGNHPHRITDIIRGNISKSRDTRDPSNMHSQLSKNKPGKMKERGFHSRLKQDLKILSTEHLHDGIEQHSDGVEELLDSLEFHKGFSDHLRHLTARQKSTMSWFIDSLEQPKHSIGHTSVIKGHPKASEVKGQPPRPEFRTASSLLSMLLQTESLFGCAVQLLTLLCQTCTPGSALFAVPVDPVMLRAALRHHDDGVRAAGCNLLTCLEPDLGQTSPRSNGGPNWTIEPVVFKDLLSHLSDSAPSVRRSACKAVVKWLGMMRKTEVTSKGDQHLQEGTECRRRTISAPAVTDRGRMRVRVEGVRQQIKANSGLPLSSLGTYIEGEEWLKVALGAASPAVSLLSDSDAVIRQQGCIILGSMAAITGGESALMSADAPHQLLRLARADSHHAVRRQALSTLCAFSQQDTLQQALKSIEAELKLHHISQISSYQSSYRWMGQAEMKHNVDSTQGKKKCD
ncbi:serine/threonine-protein kinase 36 isoform X1 [Ictalurus furcatus]|uniref:serine/threonine-protein kinase 36 isoform X1 n=1 Tax=Ictalurus furcatus TaxID=66913 RepID=UPI00234FCE11|nr:serine/threonine-protein kinase 36 isoform X1 [Ictalurus furcatus]